MNSSASAIVLCIFQLPAMNGVRLMHESLHAGQRLALDQLERRAAAGREVVDPVGEPELRERRGGVAAADDRRRRASPATASATARVPGRERLELERAHRAVPEHRARAARSPRRSARAVRGADVEAHPAVGHVDAVELAALGVGRERARRATRSVGSRSLSPPRPRARAAPARCPPPRTARRRRRGPGP